MGIFCLWMEAVSRMRTSTAVSGRKQKSACICCVTNEPEQTVLRSLAKVFHEHKMKAVILLRVCWTWGV